MAEFFLFFSLISLFFLLLSEPITLRVRFGDGFVIGIHLAVFALLLFPGEASAKKKKPKDKGKTRKKKKASSEKSRRLTESAALLRAGLSALKRYADRPSVRIFILAPKEEPLPERAALSHGRYAVLVSLVSLALHGFFPRTVTDADVLSEVGGTRFDLAVSVSLSDLFLMALCALRARRKILGNERILLWKKRDAREV